MIYAKCIRKSQIANSKEEFLSRQGYEENNVYCVGETTIGMMEDTLFCVPLNYIFCCLKYGDYIAILDISDNQDYPTEYNYSNYTKSMDKQKIIKIMKAESKEAIDFVADCVKNHSCIVKGGYIDEISDDKGEAQQHSP